MSGLSTDPGSAKSVRSLMRKLGFQSPTIKKAKDVPGVFVLTAYDPVDNYYFCQSYSEADLRCIAHANLIFWRYVK